MSQTPTHSKTLLSKLSLWQGYWLVLLSAWLPISITTIWIGIIVGSVFWIATSALAWKEGAYEVSEDEGVSKFQALKLKVLSIIGLDGAPLLLPLGIFVLAVFASGFFVGFEKGSFEGGFRVGSRCLVSLKAFIIYPWVYQTLRRCPQVKAHAVCALLLVGSLSCLYAPIEPNVKPILRYFTDNPPKDGILLVLYNLSDVFIRWVTGSRIDFRQGTGFLEQPMAFAGQVQTLIMVALALVLCLGYKKLPGIFKKRSIAIAIACCITIGVIFAAERSAWLGVFFGVLVLCGSISRKTLIAALLSLFVVAGLSYAFVPIVTERIDVLKDGKDPSVTARFIIWEKTCQRFKEKPLFGCAITRFPHIPMATATMPNKGYFDHAHSNYLHILATTGIVGFAAYLYLLYVIFSTTFKLSKPVLLDGLTDKEVEQLKFDRSIALGLLAASASLAVSGLFEFNFGTGHVRLTYFYWLAFLSKKT